MAKYIEYFLYSNSLRTVTLMGISHAALFFSCIAAPCQVNDRGKVPVPLKVHLIGAGEYKPVESLGEFKKHLERQGMSVTTSLGNDSKKLPNLDALQSADVMLLFVRRMDLPEEQMVLLRKHWQKGKGGVALRTASHAFQPKDNEVFSKVLGGTYLGPGSYTAPFKAVTADGQKAHPVLDGVGPIASRGAYRFELSKTALVLQVVESDKKVKAPATWVHEHQGVRIFYSTMGSPEDFQNESFRRLLVNAIFWTTCREAPKASAEKN